MLNDYPPGSRWPYMWKVAKRFNSYFNSMIDGTDKSNIYEFDIIHAFFVFCYHLKDWIIRDFPSSKEQVENYINGSVLRHCADFCNEIKHLNRRKPRTGHAPDIPYIDIGENGRPIFMIETDEGDQDACELAGKCIDAWYEYIRVNIDPNINKDFEF